MKICIFYNSLYPLYLIDKLLVESNKVVVVIPDFKHQEILELKHHFKIKSISFLQISKAQLKNCDPCLLEHLNESDILSIHLNLNDQTKNLIKLGKQKEKKE